MEIALRCYADTPTVVKQWVNYGAPRSAITLTFDTETTTDQYENLTFGSCFIHVNERLERVVLFYNEQIVKPTQVQILKQYTIDNHVELMTRTDFITNVFYPYTYKMGALAVGFNLPFDLARLASRFSFSRIYPNGFSLEFSPYPWIPRLSINSMDSKKSFFKFAKPQQPNKNSPLRTKRRHQPGRFLDLRTFTFALTNESYSLDTASKAFETRHHKTSVESHGIITPEYIGYNLNDTLVTYELYEKALSRYRLYNLDKQPEKIFSPASIGKAYLSQMGIRPFLDKNPDFPKTVLGYSMTTYYGGRTDNRIRKKPVKVDYLDFTSMYPSLYVLLGLDKYLKADKIILIYNTDEVQRILNDITINDLQNKETWKKLACICRLKPDGEILPVRANYAGKSDYNIGQPIVHSEVDLWYSLPDLIASKFLTGKTPIIMEAISFEAVGIQNGLKPITLVGNINVDPGEDLIKKIIEERQRIRKELNNNKNLDDKSRARLEVEQKGLKTVANGTAYGIYIEINSEKLTKKSLVTVYGLRTFQTFVDREEEPAIMFNPIIATTITSGAKLVLAMVESIVHENNGVFAYCDTDSVFINPECTTLVQDFFRSLNPYDTYIGEMFKIETDEKGKELKDVWFYGVSAKRYALYDYGPDTGIVTIRKASLHGLGQLLGINGEEIWHDYLTAYYHPERKSVIEERYDNRVCVSELTLSKYDKWKCYDTPGIPLESLVKPFNFVNVGPKYQCDPETGEQVRPMRPYVNPKDKKKFESIQYMSFNDYKTGKLYTNDNNEDTSQYWKPLKEMLFGYHGYFDHPEYKAKGDIGQLERHTITITQDMIGYIGKESNDLEERQLGIIDNPLTRYDTTSRFNDRILNMKEAEVNERGISRESFYRAKRKIKETGNIGRSKIRKTLQKELKANPCTIKPTM